MVYDKYFYEGYAALILKNKLGVKAIIEDKPDININDMKLGVEVTRSLDQEECEFRAYANKFAGNVNNAKYIVEKVNKKYGNTKNKYKIRKIRKTTYYSLPFDEKNIINRINARIADKLEKLNKDYRECGQYGLYIFGETQLINEKTVEEIVKNIDMSQYTKKLDLLYIDAIENVYMIDLKELIIETANITREEIMKTKYSAGFISNYMREHKLKTYEV